MFGGIIFCVCLVVSLCLDSALGRGVLSTVVITIGFAVVFWITNIEIFITLIKLCIVAIVCMVVWAVLRGIFEEN